MAGRPSLHKYFFANSRTCNSVELKSFVGPKAQVLAGRRSVRFPPPMYNSFGSKAFLCLMKAASLVLLSMTGLSVSTPILVPMPLKAPLRIVSGGNSAHATLSQFRI